MGGPKQERYGQLIDQLVERITRWRLAAPAILFLEVTKPLSFIASQGLLLCQPLSSFLNAEQQVMDFAGLLADRSNIEQLVARLEQGSRHKEIG